MVAVAGIEVALRRQALGEQNVVRRKLDMDIRHGIKVLVSHDGGTVHIAARLL